jgi:hypothetical protein
MIRGSCIVPFSRRLDRCPLQLYGTESVFPRQLDFLRELLNSLSDASVRVIVWYLDWMQVMYLIRKRDHWLPLVSLLDIDERLRLVQVIMTFSLRSRRRRFQKPGCSDSLACMQANRARQDLNQMPIPVRTT